jgi:hypothetical protein
MTTHPVMAHRMTQEGSSPSNLRYPAWQREYEAALREPDSKKLLERVHAAETAIFNRLQELAQNPDHPDHTPERQAIAEALSALQILKRDRLNFPDWKTE